ncbi:hypothetical protein LBW62_24290 [Ralstonia solanacearum]|uniref:hypothetical protein n=1 Tax=Ralstonia solanacearum TaxID=305 RepID=UPI0006966CD1|nr:hypothetical protein [Ralstonia solanacearum]MDB0544367.1 hypothetical protein [Ralstonia solanacearum]MDB0554202.1 hypothetical protein [Ralstonia solanacearum]MDB0559284.1 hypothetical protein [Ralstonia solanacearum]
MPLASAGAALIAAGELVLDQAKSELLDQLKEKVIGRLSHRRATRFFDTFIEEVRKEQDVKWASADLNDMLNSVAKNEQQASVLFDAYRHVALSASKDIGPMIIGLLTAEIVLEDRGTTEGEELVFEAAETLRDRDFEVLDSWLTWAYEVNEAPLIPDQDLIVVAKTSPIHIGGISMRQMHQGEESPLVLAQDVGPFAVKLRNLGLLSESVRPRPVGQIGATEYLVSVSPECQRLNRLAQRARQALHKR